VGFLDFDNKVLGQGLPAIGIVTSTSVGVVSICTSRFGVCFVFACGRCVSGLSRSEGVGEMGHQFSDDMMSFLF